MIYGLQNEDGIEKVLHLDIFLNFDLKILVHMHQIWLGENVIMGDPSPRWAIVEPLVCKGD